jgi:hypothetical protein
MKTTINTRVILLLTILILHMWFVFRNPSGDYHRDFYIHENLKSSDRDNRYIVEMVYCVAERHLKVDNYTIFSIGKLDEDGHTKVISVGFLGKIYPVSYFKNYQFIYSVQFWISVSIIFFLWFKKRINFGF